MPGGGRPPLVRRMITMRTIRMMMIRMYEWCNGGAVASHDSHDEWEWEGSLARYGQ